MTVALAANPNPLGRLYMPRRPRAHVVGAESSRRITAIQIARAQLFGVDVDRKKRIDDAIDYFGAGHIAVARQGVRQLQPARTESTRRKTAQRSREQDGVLHD
jgi:Tfp pilus assembly protein PilV